MKLWPKSGEAEKKKKISDKLQACQRCGKDKKSCSLSAKSRSAFLRLLEGEGEEDIQPLVIKLPKPTMRKIVRKDDGKTGTLWGSCLEPVLFYLLDKKEKVTKLSEDVESPRTSDEMRRLTDQLERAQLEVTRTVEELVELARRRSRKGKARVVVDDDDDDDDDVEEIDDYNVDDGDVFGGFPEDDFGRMDIDEEKGEGPSKKRKFD